MLGVPELDREDDVEQPSASISRIDYDDARLRLTVVFTGGQSVVHIGVPSGIHAAFLQAGHRGAFYVERIRDQYRLA